MNDKERADLLLEAVKMIEAVRDAEIASAAYTPPCDAPEGFEWAGEYRQPDGGEWFWHNTLNEPQCARRQGRCLNSAHILRRLPAKCEDCGGTGRDRVPYGERCDSCNGDGSKPSATTGEGVGAVEFEGDPDDETLPANLPTRWVPEPTKWYVWSREAGPPNVPHATHAEAKAEAERLAAKHPGREFKVLGQVGENIVVQQQPARFKKGDRVLIEAKIADETPNERGDVYVDLIDGEADCFVPASALRPAKGVGE